MTAWETLIHCNITKLPIDLDQICKSLGILLCSYTQGYQILKESNLGNETFGADGFLIRGKRGAVILYNPHLSPGRRRYTVAHEIGHYCLNHGTGIIHRDAKEQKPRPQIEIEADRFAAQLLSPACVLRALHVGGPFAIRQLCHISQQAAEIAFQRLKRLHDLDAQWMEERSCSYFFQSGTEWCLYRQFEPYILATTRHLPAQNLCSAS